MRAACLAYQDDHLWNLKCKRVQCDEIWSFCYAKPKNLPEHLEHSTQHGDVWTWTALCADTKLLVSWFVGKRETSDAIAFMGDVQRRMANRIQLTTDGHMPYLIAVKESFGDDVDFAQLVKIYAPNKRGERSWSPNNVIGAKRTPISGEPDTRKISTSFVERSNLTMRMGMRRFTRATNAFSKKIENLRCAVTLHFMHYNFARVHQTLNKTPAMAAGIAEKPWTLEDIVSLLD